MFVLVLQENCVELKSDMAENKNTNSIPSSSTGAIPKSISFDKTAERGDKVNHNFDYLLQYLRSDFYVFLQDVDDEPRNKRGSFFRNIKLPFKSRGRKSTRPGHEDSRVYDSNINSNFKSDNYVIYRSSDSSDYMLRSRKKGDEMVLGTSKRQLNKLFGKLMTVQIIRFRRNLGKVQEKAWWASIVFETGFQGRQGEWSRGG